VGFAGKEGRSTTWKILGTFPLEWSLLGWNVLGSASLIGVVSDDKEVWDLKKFNVFLIEGSLLKEILGVPPCVERSGTLKKRKSQTRRSPIIGRRQVCGHMGESHALLGIPAGLRL
jgi:hypothetical protein